MVFSSEVRGNVRSMLEAALEASIALRDIHADGMFDMGREPVGRTAATDGEWEMLAAVWDALDGALQPLQEVMAGGE